MATQFVTYPSSAGVQTYANFAALPASAADGTIAETLDTYSQYIFESGSSTWVLQATAGGAPLSSAHLFVGNGSNVATDVAVSGDLTLVNTGAFTLAKIQGTVVSGTTGTTNVVFSAGPTLTGNIGLGAAWSGIFSSSEGTDVTKSISADAGVATAALVTQVTRSGTGAQTNNMRGARFNANRDVTAGAATGDGGGFYGLTTGVNVTNGANAWTNAGTTAALQIHQLVTTGAGTITTTYTGLRIEADSQAITGTMTAIYAGAPTGGTSGNAVLSDNTSYSGTWFINQSGSSASKLGGNLTAPKFISGSGTTSSTGIFELANADLIGWRNASNAADYTLGLDGNNLLKYSTTGTSILAIDSSVAAVPSLALQFQDTNAGNTAKNWRVGANIIANGNFDFVPSTAAAGTTFSTTALTLKTTGTLVSNSSGDVTDPAFQVLVGGSTKAGMWPSSNGCSFAYSSTEVAWFTASNWTYAVPVYARFNGSAGSPQLLFNASDSNTGFYRSASNEVSFSAQSTQTFKMAKNAVTVIGQETITGAADVVQLTVTGNGTQTSNLVLVQNSSSTALLTITNAGVVNLSNLTASQAVFTDASKNLVSNAISGSGNVMMSASPTTTGTLTAAAINASGTINLSGLTASLPVQTDASKNLVSLAIDVSGSQATGVLAAARFPALTGDVTTASGALATTVVKIAGTTVSGTTGTTNVVFSASPTLTGTITAANENLSGTLSVVGQTVHGSATADNTGASYNVQVLGTSAAAAQIRNVRYSADASGTALRLGKSRGASIGTLTAVTTNDVIGTVLFEAVGTDAAAYSTAATIQVITQATVGSGVVPAKMTFNTSSASGVNTNMVIDPNGNVVLGNQAALATNATDGFTYIPTSAGAPSGTPTAFTGKVAMQYDTTNNKLYIYNGAWKSVTLA